MIQGKSVLNPYATPYIPLSKTFSEVSFEGEKKASETEETAGYQIPGTVTLEQNIQRAEKLHVSDASSSKVAHHTAVSENDSFQDESIATEKHSLMDDPDMMMDSLSSMFPDISVESLAELFKANHGDLSETIDMLEQLELEGLPPETWRD